MQLRMKNNGIMWDGTQVAPTLTANNAGGGQRMPDKDNFNSVITPDYVVRRLTPTECARLQGFPDWWCDGIPHGDAAEYKMWGNGMALPCALYVMEGAEEYFNALEEEKKTD